MDDSWELSVTWVKHGHQLIIDNQKIFQDSHKGKILLEIGSDRGEGSTEKLALLAKQYGLWFITVDMNPEISIRCEKIVRDIDNSFISVCSKGEEYIANLPAESIAVLYLDAYDTMPPGYTLPPDMAKPYTKNLGGWNNDAAWAMHLKACQKGHNKIIPSGYVCFDDVWRKNRVWAQRSKGYLAIPWLMSMDYEEVDYVDGSILLQKK